MKDKEIQGMQIRICNACKQHKKCDKELCTMSELVAKEVSRFYQPKLPEDSVVLSREEYEKLKNESIDKLFADDTFFKEEFKANEEYLRKRADRDYIKLVKKQASKETAENFAKRVKELSQEHEVKTLVGRTKIYYIGNEGLNEIVREFGGETKEQL